MIPDFTDEQLVVLFKETGDNKYFGMIYDRHYQKVYHTCLGIVKNRDIAYDMVQDIMIKVLENLPKLQNGFLLGLWIHRIAKNNCLDYCKSRNTRQEVNSDAFFDLAEEESDPEALAIREHYLNNMDMILSELKEEDRKLLAQKYFQDCSVEELQQQYALSESAVKMRLSRARSRMIKLYQKKVPTISIQI